MNAEIYAKKGDFATATSLYEGVISRINDLETNHKIEANVEYLRRYREYLNPRRKRKSLSNRGPRREGTQTEPRRPLTLRTASRSALPLRCTRSFNRYRPDRRADIRKLNLTTRPPKRR
jgi:hypothetical protein